MYLCFEHPQRIEPFKSHYTISVRTGRSMEFIELQVGPFVALAWKPWVDEGFIHGFVGKTGHFRDKCFEADLSTLAEALGVPTVLTLKQVHMDGLVWVNTVDKDAKSVEADGWLRRERSAVAVGILTADCMPVVVKADSGAALVHVGWRGLVCGVATQACDNLYKTGSRQYEVIVGPAASAENYEVGEEVLQAIGSQAVVRREAGQSFLSLVGTLERQLLTWASSRGASLSVNCSQECTMGGQSYHSHRRDGSLRGSNIAWIR
jgi:copper oxidase (laccase) domain-containing protein